jgi:hypothetical protein
VCDWPRGPAIHNVCSRLKLRQPPLQQSYAQMVADWLGVLEDKIHLAQADAADIAFADGAFTIAGTDRSMPIVINAILDAPRPARRRRFTDARHPRAHLARNARAYKEMTPVPPGAALPIIRRARPPRPTPPCPRCAKAQSRCAPARCAGQEARSR